ncbi:hypothetical protein PV682_32335 [Streptomyces niveiscabiei]|uniref:hypothetical protein n=1 Tax=Streptomyces niveiscabiei TaxID=164115 RepID=UPI0029B329CD|nr:hypothetical protein [Streptomyces niveiscabiei]MDX3386111.1 hypothetical protein [Streptomyces niveiscabiei]
MFSGISSYNWMPYRESAYLCPSWAPTRLPWSAMLTKFSRSLVSGVEKAYPGEEATTTSKASAGSPP